jgi:hypothetical protein
MKDEELREKLQEIWSDHNCCEILLTRDDLRELIKTLMDVFERSIQASSRNNPISLQFLGLRDANSSFIRNIKVTRLHTLYKFSLSKPAQNCTITTQEEVEKLVVDFENKIDDILDAIVQG